MQLEIARLAAFVAASREAIAANPSEGGITPRPVRLILAAATGSAAMPADSHI